MGMPIRKHSIPRQAGNDPIQRVDSVGRALVAESRHVNRPVLLVLEYEGHAHCSHGSWI